MSVRAGEIDILVGTQMVTKGHDLPNVTLVGVLNADSALSSVATASSDVVVGVTADKLGSMNGTHVQVDPVGVTTSSLEADVVALGRHAAAHAVDHHRGDERRSDEPGRAPVAPGRR